MKLNFGKRLLLFFHWLLSLLIAVFVFLNALTPNTVAKLAAFVNGLVGVRMAQVIALALYVVYALLMVFALSVLMGKDKKHGDRGFITVDSSDSGKTRISIGAVDQMVRQAVRGVDGIAEMKSSIINNEDSISINSSVILLAGAHVPTVTMNIQRAIRGYIELNCGVAVRDICVSVNSVENSGEGKKGVRRNAAVPVAAEPVAEPEIPLEPIVEIAVEPAAEEIHGDLPYVEENNEEAAE